LFFILIYLPRPGMKLLPYENFHIISKLTPGEIVEKLKEVTRPNTGYAVNLSGINPNGPNTTFKGFINSSDFKFEPAIIYRNSFLPQITGSIEPFGEGSRVDIKMALYTPIGIIVGILLSIAGFFCIKFFPHLISDNHTETDIIPFLFFCLSIF